MRGLFSPNIQSTIRCDSFSSVASHDLSTLKHDFQHRLTLQFLEYRPVSWLGFIRHELIDSRGQCILTRIVRLACNSRVLTIHQGMIRIRLLLFHRVVRRDRFFLGLLSDKTAPSPTRGRYIYYEGSFVKTAMA